MHEKKFAAKISQTAEFLQGGYGYYRKLFYFAGPLVLRVSKEPKLLTSEEVLAIRDWKKTLTDPGAYVDFFVLEHTGRSSPK